MANTRLETLQQMLDQDPENSFSRYGLAMEYVRANDLGNGRSAVRRTVAAQSGLCGRLLPWWPDVGETRAVDGARQMYRKGIEVTTRTGDAHTRSELQAALDILG